MSNTTNAELSDGAPRLVLIWHRPGESADEFSIWPERPVTIGRDASNLIALDSPFVSKAHARISYVDGRYVLEDLRSANGTRVNGSRIEECNLKPGDIIEIGDQELSLAVWSEGKRTKRVKHTGSSSRAGLAGGAAVLALVAVLGVWMWPRVTAGPNAEPPDGAGAAARPAEPMSPRVDLTAAGEEPMLVVDVVGQAKLAGVDDVAALFDEAMLQYRGGRLRDTQILLKAVLRRDAGHELARLRLGRVEQETQRSIMDHMTRGDLAFSQLRYDDAVIAWEQVQLLTDAGDPRYQRAEQRATEARRARGR